MLLWKTVDSFCDIRTTVTGKREALKDSQHCSDEFGFAVLSIYEEYQQKHRSDADQCGDLESLDPLDVSTAAWADLESAALWASLYEE